MGKLTEGRTLAGIHLQVSCTGFVSPRDDAAVD